MGFSEGVQWWEEWQLRLLVLASLFLQYFLFLGALLRKGRIASWFRSLIWLAYHCCDLVVIYALATLLNQSNRMEELAMNHGSSTHLGALWASILLLHLGGQDGLTAYSIEDNENWRRQFLIAVSQITVVIYVLRKSWWSDDVKLLRAAIVLFVPGILKCLEKPWALKTATMASIMSSPDSRMETTLREDNTLTKDKIDSLDKYLKEAADMVEGWMGKDLPDRIGDEAPVHGAKGADEPYHLFVDVGHPYIIRLRNLQLMLPLGARNELHALVRSSLSKAFDRFYTKRRRSAGWLRRLLRGAAVLVLPFVGVGLFQQSRRGVYERADVAVTYVLLCCTAALELISACVALASGLQASLDDQVDQYNLIGHLVRNKEHQRLTRLADRLGCKGLQLDRLWRMELPEPSTIITKLVYDHVLVQGWKEYVKPTDEIVFDPTDEGMFPWMVYEETAVGAYRRFNDSRGQRALAREKKGDYGGGMDALWSSLRVPFDESLVLWHLATEFCYFEHADTGSDAIHYSRAISNYMAYLLLVNPEMVMPGARSSLLAAVRHELQASSEHRIELEPTDTKLASQPMSKDEVARRIIRNVKCTVDVASDSLIHRAWALAHELMEFAKIKAEEEEKKKLEEYKEKKKREEEYKEQKKREEEKQKKKREEEKMEEKQKREEEEKKKREEEEKKRREEEEEEDEEKKKKKREEEERKHREDEGEEEKARGGGEEA
ncbi:hypothetical protein BS78_05G172800 [Paspalum vaginatum]|nr:hypothetical protein BS78_05G172800 [Paspalum vaginatum]